MNILLDLLDKPIAFQRSFLKIMNVNCALFLSQCVHWQKYTKDEFDGWFCRTIDQFKEETGLSRKEQDAVKKVLISKGIISTERRGAPAKLWITINTDTLYQLLTDAINEENGTFKNVQKGHSRVSKKDILECTKGTYSIYKEDKELKIRNNDKNYLYNSEEKNFLNFSEIEDLEHCDQVKITEDEFEKLKSKYDYEILKNQILQLDTYLTNNPKKKYKSHYKTLIAWVVNFNGKSIYSKGVGGKSSLTGKFGGNGDNLGADGYSDYDLHLIEQAKNKKVGDKNE